MKQTKLPFARKPSSSADESDSEGMISEYESAGEDDAFEEEVRDSAKEPAAFNKELLMKIVEDLDSKSLEMYKVTLKRMDWSAYASPQLSKDQLKEMASRLCKLLIRNLTLKELLTAAVSNKRYLESFTTGKRLKSTRERRTNVYTMFLRDYHKNHAEVPVKDRFKLCHEVYKKLSEEEVQHFADLAAEENLQPRPSKTKMNGHAEKSPRANKASTRADKASTSSSKENVDKIVINSADYFAEDRKKTHGEEKSSVVKQAYAALSDKERVKLIYRIIQSVEKTLNKRPILCKPDQDFLNNYEGRPQPPGTSYNLFMIDKSDDPILANLPARMKASKGGELWRQLDAPSKESYERKFAKIKAEYDSKYQRFLANLPEFRRVQETAIKKRKRRASLGEIPEQPEAAMVPAMTPAKRRVRSKTIDCSSTPSMREFLTPAKEPTSAKAKKRKGEPSIANGASVESEAEITSPKKAKKDKKKKKMREAAPSEDNDEAPSTPPPESTPAKSYKKDKSMSSKKDKTKSPKKDKTKEPKKSLPEPLKPPASVKDYFKTVIYTGDPDKARKAYKKVSLEDKERYHKELSEISANYLVDLNLYLKSLSKEELAEYTERNN